ncbi:hypothetical protein [Pseudomonas putida]|uniref:hypothetical protein n=1 Tax=Pseudomonas putida TaxID=303 RepID=UPI000A517967|nr:hypothetical protein [Pseudomonas putida]
MEINNYREKKVLPVWLVALMLILPQVGISLNGFFIDAYRLLLALLFLDFFICLTLSKKLLISGRLLIFWSSFFLSVMLPFFIQSQLNEVGDFFAHITNLEGRSDPNLTFGDASYVRRDFFGMLGLKFFSVVVLGFLLSFYISKLSVSSALKFSRSVVFSAVCFQAFYMVLYFFGVLDSFANIFMIGATASQFDGGVSNRLGFYRFPGGFSEPSFMAVVIFGAVFSYYYIASRNDIRVSFFSRVSLALMCFFLFATTISMMTMFVFVFSFFFIFWSSIRKSSIELSCFVFVVVAFLLQFFSMMFSYDFIPQGLESIAVRQLMVTALSDLSVNALLFGYAFSEVYNFPFVTNLILQLGCVGTLGILFSFFCFSDGKWILLSCFVLILSVSPNLSYSYLYVFLGCLVGSLLVKSSHR